MGASRGNSQSGHGKENIQKVKNGVKLGGGKSSKFFDRERRGTVSIIFWLKRQKKSALKGSKDLGFKEGRQKSTGRIGGGEGETCVGELGIGTLNSHKRERENTRAARGKRG